jgi:hypothetical protein
MSGYLWGAGLLAASDSLRNFEFDWPSSPGRWAVTVTTVVVMIAVAVGCYRLDTRGLSRGWRVLLTALRLAAIAGLLVIAVNPQERIRQMAFRPSRVAILADTSLSMRFPEKTASTSTPAEAQRNRADAVRALLGDSPLLAELQKQHNVRIYTFDSGLTSPPAVILPAQAERAAIESPRPGQTQKSGAENKKADSNTAAVAGASAVDWNEILRPRGLETRLGEAVIQAVQELGGRTLSGIVVISDGDSNAGIEPSTAQEVAKGAGARLITLGVGSTEAPVNLQVASIQAPSDVHVGDPYEFSAFIQGYGLTGKTATVELLMRPEGDDKTPPKVIESRDIRVREDGAPIEVRFHQTPTVAGGIELFVRVRPPAGVRELSEDDNERRKTVNVIDRKLHVLIVASGPMRDYRFLHTMLNRHSSIDVDIWLQTVSAATAGQVSQESKRLLVEFPKTAAELFDYDVVVAFDPDWSRIPLDGRKNLMNWVSEHGGGMILVASDIYTPQLANATDDALKDLQRLYPVFLSASVADLSLDAHAEQPWPVALTTEGGNAGFLQLADNSPDIKAQWQEFPGVYRCYPTSGAKSGATIYANFGDPRVLNEHGPPILFAAQFYGSGRTLYLGSPEMWRLRAVDEAFYDRFWTKAIREVGQGRLRRGTARGLLLLERSQYALGQTIRIRANLLDPQLNPLDVGSVELDVFDPHGAPLVAPRSLQRDQNAGQYWADFRAAVPGTYRVLVRPEPADEKQNLTAKIDVVLPNLESDNPRQNAKLLTDLARETGGKYLPIERALAELPGLLPDRGERFAVDEQLRALWDQEWVLYLLVGLLGFEWVIRKLLRLA